MKKIFYLLIFVLLAFKQIDNKVIWKEIAKGRNSDVYSQIAKIITNTSGLHKLNEGFMKRDYRAKIDDNEVDFNKQSLIVYFAGSSVNDIKMDSINIKNNTLLVYIDRIQYSRGCYEATLLVTPYIILKVDTGSWKDYEIKTSVSTRICDEK
jgi:hypothetical protein